MKFAILAVLLLFAGFADAGTITKTPEELEVGLFEDFQKYGEWREPNSTETARDERYRLIASSIVDACKRRSWPGWPLAGCVALAATAAKWESGLLKDVHEGGRLGPSGERCLFQLHRKAVAIPSPEWRISPEEWKRTTGLDEEATQACADAGVRALGWQVARCRIAFEGGGWYPASRVFEEYHVPLPGCPVRGISEMSGKRGRNYSSLLAKIRR